MSGLEALLSNLKRAFAPGSPEAPLAWLLAAIAVLLLVLGIAVLLLRRQPKRAQRGRALLSGLRGRHPQGARDQRDRCLCPPRLGLRRGPQGPGAQAQDRPLPAGRRSTSTTPTSSAPGRRWCTAASGRWSTTSTGRAAAGADGGDERVAVEGAQEPAGAALSRHQRLRHAVPGGLLQAARDHAAARADGARQAAAADPPAQGDGRALARGERGAQGRADAHDPAGARLPDGADLPPHAARGPAASPATSPPAASRSRRRRCSTRTSPPT